MSALARYVKAQGGSVAGYDRTPSPLTRQLEKEGIPVTYTDDEAAFSRWFNTLTAAPDECLLTVVWTPAVPKDTRIYRYLQQRPRTTLMKRAELLGQITRTQRALCVAGTHGKTSTSTLLAHILQQTPQGTNAFLGGISQNYQTNLIISPHSSLSVVEADEYDRSFLHLHPAITVITAIDPDHLDIYGTAEAYQEGFNQYAALVQEAIVLKKGYHLTLPATPKAPAIYTYSANEHDPDNATADFYADRIRLTNGHLLFDWHISSKVVSERSHTDTSEPIRLTDLELNVPVLFNVENATAAMAVAWLAGADLNALRIGLQTYQGVQRRFNMLIRTPQLTYIDDYAHHPEELRTAIQSAKSIYPNRHLMGIFQPHLFSRTRDLNDGFVEVLSLLDELILLPIYPAREQPIEGVTSARLAEQIAARKGINTYAVPVLDALGSEQPSFLTYLQQRIHAHPNVVLLTLGAGSIDRLVPILTQRLHA